MTRRRRRRRSAVSSDEPHSRQRDARRAKALAFLRLRGRATAIEIGAAAVKGEPWAAPRNTWRAKSRIGLEIAVQLVRDGAAKPNRKNEFEIVQPAA